MKRLILASSNLTAGTHPRAGLVPTSSQQPGRTLSAPGHLPFPRGASVHAGPQKARLGEAESVPDRHRPGRPSSCEPPRLAVSKQPKPAHLLRHETESRPASEAPSLEEWSIQQKRPKLVSSPSFSVTLLCELRPETETLRPPSHLKAGPSQLFCSQATCISFSRPLLSSALHLWLPLLTELMGCSFWLFWAGRKQNTGPCSPVGRRLGGKGWGRAAKLHVTTWGDQRREGSLLKGS